MAIFPTRLYTLNCENPHSLIYHQPEKGTLLGRVSTYSLLYVVPPPPPFPSAPRFPRTIGKFTKMLRIFPSPSHRMCFLQQNLITSTFTFETGEFLQTNVTYVRYTNSSFALLQNKLVYILCSSCSLVLSCSPPTPKRETFA